MIIAKHAPHTVIVEAQYHGMRLDTYLSQVLDGFTRVFVQKMIKDGCIQTLQNVSLLKPSFCVSDGMSLVVRFLEQKDCPIRPIKMDLDIVFEDEHLLVLNKPAGLVVHPSKGHHEFSLAHGLMHHCKDNLSVIGGSSRPGLVHRLDKDTSGLMMVAKSDLAFYALTDQLKTRTLGRTYLAICFGVPTPVHGTIHTFLGRDPRNFEKKRVYLHAGSSVKEAITHYHVREHAQLSERASQQVSLVKFRLETGRTHQIRVHASYKGFPIVGDPLYTPSHVHQRISFPRQALHSTSLHFIHPITQKEMGFKVPLPPDMQELKEALEFS